MKTSFYPGKREKALQSNKFFVEKQDGYKNLRSWDEEGCINSIEQTVTFLTAEKTELIRREKRKPRNDYFGICEVE